MSTKIKYLDLVKQINNKEIETDDLKFKYQDEVFVLQDDIFKSVKYNGELFSDVYTDLDILDLEVELLDKEDNVGKGEMLKYKQKLIEDFMVAYETLDIELNACQGCTEDLDGQFATLNYYQKCVEELGGNFEELHKIFHAKVYTKLIDEQNKKEQEKAEKDKIIKLLEVNWLELASMSDKNLCKTISEIQNKVNEICHILRGEIKIKY